MRAARVPLLSGTLAAVDAPSHAAGERERCPLSFGFGTVRGVPKSGSVRRQFGQCEGTGVGFHGRVAVGRGLYPGSIGFRHGRRYRDVADGNRHGEGRDEKRVLVFHFNDPLRGLKSGPAPLGWILSVRLGRSRPWSVVLRVLRWVQIARNKMVWYRPDLPRFWPNLPTCMVPKIEGAQPWRVLPNAGASHANGPSWITTRAEKPL